MKERSTKRTVVETPGITAVNRLLSLAELIRRRGTPEEADEALEWEKKLKARRQELEPELPKAA